MVLLSGSTTNSHVPDDLPRAPGTSQRNAPGTPPGSGTGSPPLMISWIVSRESPYGRASVPSLAYSERCCSTVRVVVSFEASISALAAFAAPTDH